MMELLEGNRSPNVYMETGRFRLKKPIEIACQTASALAAAHACQIIHRDLKPDQSVLVPDRMLPCQTRVKVLDFGIAKLMGDLRARSAQTKSGILMGTPFYMSPEQCRGSASGRGCALGYLLARRHRLRDGLRPSTLRQRWRG